MTHTCGPCTVKDETLCVTTYWTEPQLCKDRGSIKLMNIIKTVGRRLKLSSSSKTKKAESNVN